MRCHRTDFTDPHCRVATRHGRHGWARWQHVANAGKYLISILAVWNMAALKLDSYYLEKQANVSPSSIRLLVWTSTSSCMYLRVAGSDGMCLC
jgi:hypothetical protein